MNRSSVIRGRLPLIMVVIGAIGGGVTLGAICLSVSKVLQGNVSARVGLLLGVGILTIAAEFSSSLRRWVPERACQVPARNRATMSDMALHWGFELGCGFRTYLRTPVMYTLLIVTLTAGASWIAFFPWVLYGATRGSAIAGAAERNARLGARGGVSLALTKPLRTFVITTAAIAVVLCAAGALGG